MCRHQVEQVNYQKSSVLRKYAVKLCGRVALLLFAEESLSCESEGGGSCPDDIAAWKEDVIGDILQASRDKVFRSRQIKVTIALKNVLLQDSIVRWTAAKYLSRIAEQLPPEDRDQVVDASISLFEEDMPSSADPVDLSTVSETTWHGSCLNIAELIRNRSLSAAKFVSALPWIIKVRLYRFINKSFIKRFPSKLIFSCRPSNSSNAEARKSLGPVSEMLQLTFSGLLPARTGQRRSNHTPRS